MKRHVLKALSAIGLTLAVAPAAYALSGTPKLACEAVLCLSSSERPGECSPSLRKYFSIDHRKISDTIKARRNFLQQCPWSSGASYLPDFVTTKKQMDALFDAIARGAGRCDAEFLNQHNVTLVPYTEHVWVGGDAETKVVTKYHRYVNNTKPNYCEIFENHDYTDLNVKYVGTPQQGGFWVDGKDYDRALQEYNDNLQPVNKCPNWQNIPVFDWQCQR